MKNYLLISFIAVILFASCKKILNPDELVPSYLYINDITVNTTANQGTKSDNIIDAWVYINGNLVGTWELPAKIPIHAEGEYDLKIFAGIKKSGLANLRVQNEFMNPFDSTLVSVPHKIDSITPAVTYKSGANFWIEDFEDPGVKFTKSSYSDTTLEITTDPSLVFEGNGTGVITFDASDIIFGARTNEIEFNSFPKGGKPVYFEIDYKSDEVITVGIYHNNNATSLIKEEYLNLFPTDGKWKKTYIDLKEVISPKLNATEFEVYLEVTKNKSSLPLVFIDNIKVIY